MKKKRFDPAGSTVIPAASPPGEQVRVEDDVALATTVIHLELPPATDSDELTETEWSAFMALGPP